VPFCFTRWRLVFYYPSEIRRLGESASEKWRTGKCTPVSCPQRRNLALVVKYWD